MTRHLVWFSAGAASAVATKLTLASHADEPQFECSLLCELALAEGS